MSVDVLAWLLILGAIGVPSIIGGFIALIIQHRLNGNLMRQKFKFCDALAGKDEFEEIERVKSSYRGQAGFNKVLAKPLTDLVPEFIKSFKE